MRPAPILALLCAAALLAGCDLLGLDSTEQLMALREADGKAVGGACRHAGRAIEDCYALNPKAQRPAVFAGWREMDEYMRENKLEAVAPQIDPLGAASETGAVPTPAASAPPAEPKPSTKGKPSAA